MSDEQHKDNCTHQISIGNVRVPVRVRRVDGQGNAIGEDGQQDQILERCTTTNKLVKEYIYHI